MACSKGTGLMIQDHLCLCLQLITWASAGHSSPLRWSAVTHLAQSKGSVCFLNVTMFISFELPLCELRHLNLSTFQVAVTINPCLRVPRVTQVSWIGWIKRQNVQTGGSCHTTAQKAYGPPQTQAFLEIWVWLAYWLSLVGFMRMVLFKEDGLADSEWNKGTRESWLLTGESLTQLLMEFRQCKQSGFNLIWRVEMLTSQIKAEKSSVGYKSGEEGKGI